MDHHLPLGSWHVTSLLPNSELLLLVLYFLDASGMPNAAQRADDETRLAALEGKRKRRNIPCTGTLRTVQPLCLYSQRGAALLQVNFAIDLRLLCAHARLVACTAALFSSVEFHHEGSNEWRAWETNACIQMKVSPDQ